MKTNLIFSILFLTFSSFQAAFSQSPRLKVDHHMAFDAFWCRGSMLPDPSLGIDTKGFSIQANDLVTFPESWIKEAAEKLPELQKAAQERTTKLLVKTAELVGSPFVQKDFPVFLYLCPNIEGGIGLPAVFPMFPYLKAVFGEARWKTEDFTDWYLFHEILHLYVMERVDYANLPPSLAKLAASLQTDSVFKKKVLEYSHQPTQLPNEFNDYVSLVLVHVHLDALMKQTLLALGEQKRWEQIMGFDSAHPSYEKAWQTVNNYSAEELKALMKELKQPRQSDKHNPHECPLHRVRN